MNINMLSIPKMLNILASNFTGFAVCVYPYEPEKK